MKTILSIVAVVALGAGSIFAGCGKKTDTTGTLKSFDADTKTLVVVSKKGKESKITMTPKTAVSYASWHAARCYLRPASHR